MAELDSLKRLQDQRVRLSFRDGFVVDVKLLLVDPSHDEELICDEERVVSWGPIDPSTPRGRTWAASAKDVVKVEVLPA